MGCMALESLDLSFCNGLSKPPCCESLWTLPTSLSEISLCGLLLSDETILVECFMRLRGLRSARLCGIPALNDKTLSQVSICLAFNLFPNQFFFFFFGGV